MRRADRLTSGADFRRTYSAGRRTSTKAVVVHVNLTGEDRPPRLGVSAGKAIGGAVTRNQAKRRLREAASPLYSTLPRGADVVLSATAAAPEMAYQDLVDSVRDAFGRIGARRA